MTRVPLHKTALERSKLWQSTRGERRIKLEQAATQRDCLKQPPSNALPHRHHWHKSQAVFSEYLYAASPAASRNMLSPHCTPIT